MSEKCPFCYRPLGTHTHDPILLPNGAKYKWKTDTELEYVSDISQRFYKGFTQSSINEAIELQDELKSLEITYLSIEDRTTFSPINSSGKFQILGKHIQEMRDSIEKLLTALGMTKEEFFNQDEDGNHIIHPEGDKNDWTDPSIDEHFQVKYIHLEELRHALIPFLTALSVIDGRKRISYFKLIDSGENKILDWIQDYDFSSIPELSTAHDPIHINRTFQYGWNFTSQMLNFRLSPLGSDLIRTNFTNKAIRDIATDSTYLYLSYTNLSNNMAYIDRLDKTTFSLIDTISLTTYGGTFTGNLRLAQDKEYYYAALSSNRNGFNGYRVYKINKSDNILVLDLTMPSGTNQLDVTVDDTYIYVTYYISTAIKIRKYLKDGTFVLEYDMIDYPGARFTISCDQYNVYTFGRLILWDGSFAYIALDVRNKNTLIPIQSILAANGLSFRTSSLSFNTGICTIYEYDGIL